VAVKVGTRQLGPEYLVVQVGVEEATEVKILLDREPLAKATQGVPESIRGVLVEVVELEPLVRQVLLMEEGVTEAKELTLTPHGLVQLLPDQADIMVRAGAVVVGVDLRTRLVGLAVMEGATDLLAQQVPEMERMGKLILAVAGAA